MRSKNIFKQENHHKKLNPTIVDTLYAFAYKNIYIMMAVSILIVWILYYGAKLQESIIWFLFIFVLLSARLYDTYLYNDNRDKYTVKQWYQRYVFFAFLTAVTFSSLCCFFLLDLDIEYKFLIIIIILLSLSSGVVTALSSDYRIAIIYLSIILFPIIFIVAITDNKIGYIYALILIFYFIGHVGMILRNYKHDIEFSELIEDKEVMHHLFKEAPIGIFMFDKELNIINTNEKFLKMFGNKREDMIGFNLGDIPDVAPLESFKKAMIEGSKIYNGSYKSIKGKMYWVEAKIFPYQNKWGTIIGNIVLIEDKSNEKNIQEELLYIADHDVLTGLYNRRGFRNNMQELIINKKHKTDYSLLFYIDLNQFKGINDSLGHAVGDSVLINVSQRLKDTLDDTCILNRLGGDEFLIVLPYVSDDKSVANNIARKYALKVTSVFDDPFIIEEVQLHIQASIGIIIIEPNYRNIEEIIRHADIAMYHAKKSHRHISYYNEALDVKQKELFSLQHALAYAVTQKQFTIHFQPIVSMKEEKLYAAESLIRWNHPQKGLLQPDSFIDLALQAGLLSKITWWILEEICKQITSLKREGLWKLEYISININSQQLIENNFAEEFLNILEKYDVKAKEIVIEITERSLIDNFDNTQDVINILKNSGIRCAIDDFGIGYSSLSYLKKLSFHILKIDKEFVKQIEAKSNELHLISSILNIGRQFHYTIVIEGVEEQKQKELLLSLDENLLYQGYYFSKALPMDELKNKYLLA